MKNVTVRSFTTKIGSFRADVDPTNRILWVSSNRVFDRIESLFETAVIRGGYSMIIDSQDLDVTTWTVQP